MLKGKPITLWCRACETGYGSTGEVPKVCPACENDAQWTTLRPYRLTFMDRQFLESIRIRPVDRSDNS